MNFSLPYSTKYFKNNNLLFIFFSKCVFGKIPREMPDITKTNSTVHIVLGNTGHG